MLGHLQDIVSNQGVHLHAFELASVRGAFSERTGGVSHGDFSSLNIGTNVGDDHQAIYENEERILSTLGLDTKLHANLVRPNQVHGDTVLHLADIQDLDALRKEAKAGADAILVTVPNVPVMLAFADCVPVILATTKAFAVIHSGWKGTIAHISLKAAKLLLSATGEGASDIYAYIGPHIGPLDYEVSEELAALFSDNFGQECLPQERHLDLSNCIAKDLRALGVLQEHIFDNFESCAQCGDRFYSYRAQAGHTGRHAAVACMCAL